MVVSEIISQLAEFARARLTSQGKMRIVQELKVALFEAVLRQDLEYLEHCDLWQHRTLIGNCGTMVGQVIDLPVATVEALCRLAAAVLMLWDKSGRLTAFVAVALPFRLFLNKVVEFVGDCIEQRTCLPDFSGQINACWTTLVRPSSLRTVRTFAREPVEVASFAHFLQAHSRLQERGQLIYRILDPVRTFLEHGTEIMTLWYGGQLAVAGDLEFGDLSSFLLVAQGAFDGARYVQQAAASVSAHALGPLAQMATLLTRQPRIGLDEPPIDEMPEPGCVKWTFKFEHVYFAYPGRPHAWVLQDLSFEASAGQFLGILGATGAGKSTVFALLLRLYSPSHGSILLDGRDLRTYNPLWLRRHIGFVSQDLVLCQRTIRENLFFGCIEEGNSCGGNSGLPQASHADGRWALQLAQCENTFFDAEAFPNLWHTEVGEGGSKLSGGQKQRLAVAMAVLKKPSVLLLDEATSALDEISQSRLQESLDQLRRTAGTTVICIAHRISNFGRADQLVVLKDGAAVEAGTPSELRTIPGGIFAEYTRKHLEALGNNSLANSPSSNEP